jgi:DNA-binding transcriptional ArsR family regulator
MDSFLAVADPTRRKIIELLGSGERSAGEITQALQVSAPAASQHLKALRDARLVRVRVAGQRRIYSLDPAGLDGFDDWLRQVRRYWAQRLDELERALRGEDTQRGRDEK